MALVTIGAVDLPAPTSFEVGYMDLSKAERNAKGLMIIERIATKKKLSLSYPFLMAPDLSTILTAISPVFFNVTYLDPQTNSYKTGSFYCGDRNMGMIDFINSVPRYKDLKFDLIER